MQAHQWSQQEGTPVDVPHISNGPERPEEPRTPEQPETWSRRGVLAVLGFVPAAVLTGCSASANASDSSTPRATKAPALTVTPADGTKDAVFTSPVQVTVSTGALSRVRVTGDDGSTLPGTFNDARTRWTSTRNPYSGTEYTVTAVAQGSTAETMTFTTRAPADAFVGYFTPEAGSTSGVGMPVSVNFTHAVTDRAAVEEAITVTADPHVEVVGHWFSDTRLDFRPEEYWAAGTEITLGLRLKDVQATDGVYGTQSKDVTFHIGREQISTVDLAKKTMTVRRTGGPSPRIPCPAGTPSTPPGPGSW